MNAINLYFWREHNLLGPEITTWNQCIDQSRLLSGIGVCIASCPFGLGTFHHGFFGATVSGSVEYFIRSRPS